MREGTVLFQGPEWSECSVRVLALAVIIVVIIIWVGGRLNLSYRAQIPKAAIPSGKEDTQM